MSNDDHLLSGWHLLRSETRTKPVLEPLHRSAREADSRLFKEALVRVFRNQYVAERVHRLEQLEEATATMTVAQMAHYIVELTACFVNEHPAYYAVVDAPVKYQRSQQARQQLREGFAKVFRSRKRGLSPETAFRMAKVALQILKSMNALYVDAETLLGRHAQALGGSVPLYDGNRSRR